MINKGKSIQKLAMSFSNKQLKQSLLAIQMLCILYALASA
jgi:hypothetical protein